MNVFFLLFPISFGISLFALMAFVIASRTGQFDDLDSPSERLIQDKDSKDCF